MGESGDRRDQRFVDVAYGLDSRKVLSMAIEGGVTALIAWLFAPGGWWGALLALICGSLGGLVERQSAVKKWDQLKLITVRELLQRDRTDPVIREHPLRRALMLAGVAGAAAAIMMGSTQSWWAKILALPFIYLIWLLGRDAVLTVFPPGKPGGGDG